MTKRHPHPPDRHARASPISSARRCRALAAVETAAIVINAQNGIEMMTGRMMEWAARSAASTA